MAISLPRILLISSLPRLNKSHPFHNTSPAAIYPGGDINLKIESEATVFPHPDSPTNPIISPLKISRFMLLSAWTSPKRVPYTALRFWMLRRMSSLFEFVMIIYDSAKRGLRISLKPSPNKVNPNATNVIIIPGIVIIHQ